MRSQHEIEQHQYRPPQQQHIVHQQSNIVIFLTSLPQKHACLHHQHPQKSPPCQHWGQRIIRQEVHTQQAQHSVQRQSYSEVVEARGEVVQSLGDPQNLEEIVGLNDGGLTIKRQKTGAATMTLGPWISPIQLLSQQSCIGRFFCEIETIQKHGNVIINPKIACFSTKLSDGIRSIMSCIRSQDRLQQPILYSYQFNFTIKSQISNNSPPSTVQSLLSIISRAVWSSQLLNKKVLAIFAYSIDCSIYYNQSMLVLSRKLPDLLLPLTSAFASLQNHYDTLGLDPSASFQQVKEHYLTLSKQHHPDLTQDNSSHYHNIQQAYKILKNPQSRKQYDLTLGIKHSQWQKEIISPHFRASFESPHFQDILQQSTHSRNQSGQDIESRLQEKFDSEIRGYRSRELWLNWRFWSCLVLFGVVWMSWTAVEIVLLHYEGSYNPQVHRIHSDTTLKIIPIVTR